jgi:poly(A)-specific ribonuclease
MIDTKNMCASEPELRAIFNTNTALESLRFETNKELFTNPRIDMHPEFPRYLTEMAHEAGYDAFMTGSVFLKLTSFLDKTRNPEKFPAEEELKVEKEPVKERKVDADGWDISESEEEEGGDSNWDINDEGEIFNYGSTRVDLLNEDGKMDNVLLNINNKAALVRTAFDYFDFTKQEKSISGPRNAIHVTYPIGTNFDKEAAAELFTPYGKHIVEPNDETSSFVIFENLKETVENLQKNIDEKFIIVPISEYL